MNRREAIRAIKAAARAGAVHVSRHAADSDDAVTVADIFSCLASARAFRWQPEHGTWRVVGSDCSDDSLVVTVRIDADGKVIAWTTF
ncbi:MAG: hypothetical protein EXR72_15400 [Myxococcales bacterium]|nr:hypothetical protein [Myxococcales bacterium]